MHRESESAAGPNATAVSFINSNTNMEMIFKKGVSKIDLEDL